MQYALLLINHLVEYFSKKKTNWFNNSILDKSLRIVLPIIKNKHFKI